MTERIPDQIDQLPELVTGMYPSPQFREDIESAPVLIAELIKAWTGRQQLCGTVQDAPPHRFRELFPAGTVKPRARIMLDAPEPVAQSEIMRNCRSPVTRSVQQGDPGFRSNATRSIGVVTNSAIDTE